MPYCLSDQKSQNKTIYYYIASCCMYFKTSRHAFLFIVLLLAHLSRRLIGELIVYQWSGVRRRRPASSVHNAQNPLLRNRLADQSQILCGASLGRGNEILFAASGSHDQDGRHAHLW